MKVEDIKRIGYFDNIIVDGWVDPMYRSEGIKLFEGMTLEESMNFCNNPYSNAVANLHITISGECLSRDAVEIENLEAIRSELDLHRSVTKNGRVYALATAEIIIIKSCYSIPDGLDDIGRNEEAFQGLAKTVDELNICSAGLKLANFYSHKIGKDSDKMNIAIVDKVYVHPEFRRLGISGWIHKNMVGLVTTFGLVHPDIILLTFGDFSDEANTVFGMSDTEYKDMLHNMYKHYGYSDISLIKRWHTGLRYQDIMYKLAK